MKGDELDRLLRESNPAIQLSPEERRLARSLARRSTPRRRRIRPAGFAAIALGVLTAAGASAAAAAGIWPPWAESNSFATFSVVLPSGTSCELRVGDLPADTPEEVRHFLDKDMGDIELDKEMVRKAAVELGIAESALTDDETYISATNWAVALMVGSVLEGHGFADEYRYSGETRCL